MKNSFIVVLLFLIAIPLISKSKLFEEMVELTSLKDNELLIVFFHRPGECPKCYTATNYLHKMITDSIKTDKIKIISVLNMRRDRDVEKFKKENYWDYPAMRNANILKKEYSLSEFTMYMILDGNGKNLYSVDIDRLDKNTILEANNAIEILRSALCKIEFDWLVIQIIYR